MKYHVLIPLCLVLGLHCKKEPPVVPPKIATLTLTAEDASCTEAWLKASTTQVPATVRLVRDGQPVSVFGLRSSDSLLIDEGLLPSRTYTYQLQKLASDSSVSETSASVQATTMDTTSHNFTFQIDTLGDGNSSVLYDVAIINDTLAYAVGEIYLRDSTGQIDPNAYNLAKWNGQQWQLLRIQFYTFCGQSGTGSYPAKSIFAFGPTDIWIGMNGSQVVRWSGQSQSAPSCTPVSINKIWGENPNSIWAVGNNGGIAHYNGTSWQRVESGTTVTLNDVWGGSNRWVGNNIVLVAAGNKYTTGETKLIRIKANGVVDTLSWSSPTRPRQSLWFNQHSKTYTCGSGVFSYNGRGWRLANGIPAIYTNCIRGNGINDIVVAGDFGLLGHFNGQNWQVYSAVALPGGNYEAVALRNNLAIAVGWVGGRAVALRGTRQ